MSPIAGVTLVIFGILVFAPALAAWSIRLRGHLAPRSSQIIEFPLRHHAKHSKKHREIDAA